MFYTLVESTKQKQGRQAGRYFAVTCAVYGLVLLALGVGTILTFSPVLAEEYGLTALIAPPPPQSAPLPVVAPNQARVTPVANIFAPPTRVPPDIPPAADAHRFPLRPVSGPVVPGAPTGTGTGIGQGVPNDKDVGDPPPPAPKPTPDPTPEPASKPPQTQRVSGEVLQGKAVQRIKPAYPQIARAVRASGPVQIQVTISEQGRVVDAVVLSGHPTLRGAALDAARQWVFSPTTLSNVPVKVQGILTFNFTLE